MKLSGKRVLTLIHVDFEDLEVWYPYYRLQEEGAEVIFAGEKAGNQYYGLHGVPATAGIGFGDADSQQFDAVLVPGGWAPDKLRRIPEVLAFIKSMDDRGAVIGHICHAGWVLISSGVLKGRTVTSLPAIKDDMVNAGAHWEDAEVVVDRNIVSSRRPADLPAYVKAVIELMSTE